MNKTIRIFLFFFSSIFPNARQAFLLLAAKNVTLDRLFLSLFRAILPLRDKDMLKDESNANKVINNPSPAEMTRGPNFYCYENMFLLKKKNSRDNRSGLLPNTASISGSFNSAWSVTNFRTEIIRNIT